MNYDLQYAQAWNQAFSRWEHGGRGWDLYDFGAELEPPFAPISVEQPSLIQITDDARTAGGVRGFLQRRRPGESPLPAQLVTSLATRKPPEAYYRKDDIAELQLHLARELDVTPAMSEQMLLSLGHFKEPLAFELIGDRTSISIQLACAASFAEHLKTEIKGTYPQITCSRRDGFLAGEFRSSAPILIIDFGLSNSFLFTLREFRTFYPDPLGGLIAALSGLVDDERMSLQVMFVPARRPWAEAVQRMVADPEQRELLNEINANYAAAIRSKFASPLFAVSIRIAAQAGSTDRCWTLLRQFGGSLRQFGMPAGNELVALASDNYPESNHRLSFFSRTNHRSGMLLNTSELASLVHVPGPSIQNGKLCRNASRTKAAPPGVIGHRMILGENTHDGALTRPSLSEEQRTRHIHIIGSTGSGKSNLLLNMITQDIEAGSGLCAIDPAGDLVDAVVANIPDSRLDDVILFDPADIEHPIGLNVLHAHSELEKTLIASDLTAAFRRMATSWGDIMNATLENSVLAILESDRGGTLLDLRKFLTEKSFREEFLESVKDDAVRYFWTNEFPLVTGRPQASILIRLDSFLRQKTVRNIVCQKDSKLDFRSIMDNRKILLVKLSQGMIGVENAHLLGTVIVTKLHQIGLSRQDTTTRPFFAIYADEFHNLVGPSVEPILSGIRKFNISLALSHQEFRQLQSRSREIAASVMSNCYTRICFRLGDDDADRFAGGFSSFDSADLKNLAIGQAIARVERSDNDFNLRTTRAPVAESEVAKKRRAEVIERSRQKYAVSKSAAEEMSKSRDERRPSGAKPVTETAVRPAVALSTVLSPAAASPPENSEHKYLQRIVKRIAEKYGFIATIEQPVLGGVGRIDVALDNGAMRIACEVAITNSVEYELSNVQKCLGAGYDHVVVLSSDGAHLREIQNAAGVGLSAAQLSRVKFIEPANIHLLLERLQQESDVAAQVKIKGYHVETSYGKASKADAEIIAQTLAETLDRRSGK